MHAVVVTADIEAGRADEAENYLNASVIPGAKARAGFVRGVWLRSGDKSNARSVQLYDTEENATAAVAAVEQGPPPGSPVKIRSVEVFEVLGEA